MRISDWSSDVCSSDLIHQTTLCQHDDLLAVRKFDQVGARLDLGPLVIGQRRDLDLAVEMADVAHDRHRLHRSHMFGGDDVGVAGRSEEHTSELQSLMRISYAVFCLKKKKITVSITKRTTLHITLG